MHVYLVFLLLVSLKVIVAIMAHETDDRSSLRRGASSASLQDYCAAFAASDDTYCSDVGNWEGVLRDLFSPDDTCPESTRYVDLRDGALEVSASNTDDNCNSTWGRRYDVTTTVNPTLIPGIAPCMRNVSFISKIPPGTALYPDAQAGALNFTLTLGAAFGSKVFRWNGVYNGQGGDVNGNSVGASVCDNFWLFESDGIPTDDNSSNSNTNNALFYWGVGLVSLAVILFCYLLSKGSKKSNNSEEATKSIETTVNPVPYPYPYPSGNWSEE